jgi:phage shock protein A
VVLNEDLIAFLGALLLVLNIMNILFTWWRTRGQSLEKREKEISAQFEQLSQERKADGERMERLDARIASMEQSMRILPGRDDLHELQLSMRSMQGDMKALTAVMEGNAQIMTRLETVVGRHEQHLLDGGK